MKLKNLLEESQNYFEQLTDFTGNHNDGWKLSIQGKTVEDVIYLIEKLGSLLYVNGAAFKVATKKLIDSDVPEQRFKAMTVYIPNGVDAKSFARLVQNKIEDYKGHEGVDAPTSYTHFEGGVYYRNDRTEDGNYIPAHDKYHA